MSNSCNLTVVSPPKKKLKLRSSMETSIKSDALDIVTNDSASNADQCAIDIEIEEQIRDQDPIANFQQLLIERNIPPDQLCKAVNETEINNDPDCPELSSSSKPIENCEFKWKGKPLDAMRNFISENKECPPVHNSAIHTVCFQVPFSAETISVPHPLVYEDKWDDHHVKMPCSDLNLYPVYKEGESSLKRRWELVKEAYSKPINTSLELEKAMLIYNSRQQNIWDFQQFHTFINKVLPRNESEHFFQKTLPGIISLAMSVSEKVTRAPALLVRQKERSITLSQIQIASLLANAFLCTFPHRNTQKKRDNFSPLPDINFIRLFENKSKSSRIQEKLKCLFNYFDRVSEKEPSGVLTFTRQVISEAGLPNWENVTETLSGFHVSSEGTIEKEGVGLVQMDFANRYIGGGVLGWGCVQEEIRFITCPELIVACLFTEVLEKNEALTITGVEQYCRFSGYSETFRFEGDFVDTTPRDRYERRMCKLVAIDAVKFRNSEIQYRRDFLTRELNKAFVGFHCPKSDVPLVAVASGNWGCGAYRGNPRLKCLLQLMAASLARRDVAYFTFGDELLRDELFQMHSVLTDKQITIGSLYQILCQYDQLYGQSKSPSLDLFGYIYAVLDTFDSDGGDMDSNPSESNPE